MSLKNKACEHEKQNNYDLKQENNLKFTQMNSRDFDDQQSDESDYFKHQVYLEDPEFAHGVNKEKVSIKTHQDHGKEDNKNDIILLINQVV